MQQLSFFNFKEDKISNNKKRTRYEIPTYLKQNKIHQEIIKWNTIKHIYRYQTLYKLYNKLFILTYNHKLACLNYYIEDDGEMYAEIDETSAYSLKERVLKHIQLIRDIKNGVELEYDEKKIDSDIITLFD